MDSAFMATKPAFLVQRARGNATVLRAVTSAGGVAAVSAAVWDAEEAKLGRAHLQCLEILGIAVRSRSGQAAGRLLVMRRPLRSAWC